MCKRGAGWDKVLTLKIFDYWKGQRSAMALWAAASEFSLDELVDAVYRLVADALLVEIYVLSWWSDECDEASFAGELI